MRFANYGCCIWLRNKIGFKMRKANTLEKDSYVKKRGIVIFEATPLKERFVEFSQ